MTNQLSEDQTSTEIKDLTAKEIKSKYWEAISEVRGMNKFFFNLIDYPKKAWIHVIVLGLIAGVLVYLDLDKAFSYSEKKFVEKIDTSWAVMIIYWFQMFMVTLAYSRWKLVNIATGIELRVQEDGAHVHPDDDSSRIALMTAISFTNRFMISDMLFGLFLFVGGIVFQKLIVAAIFLSIHL